jgi:hypothetical protein
MFLLMKEKNEKVVNKIMVSLSGLALITGTLITIINNF